MNLRYWLRHPGALANQLREVAYGLVDADRPFLAPAAIDFLDRTLPRQGDGLEWGSGRSTCWLAQRLAHLTSIEHDAEWHAEVTRRLQALGIGNVDYRFVPLDHPAEAPTRPTYRSTPRYVSVIDGFPDGHFDFIEVDGHYRQACVLAAITKLKPGGLLLVDDSDWIAREEWAIPQEWPLSHASVKVNTTTSIWRKPPAEPPG